MEPVLRWQTEYSHSPMKEFNNLYTSLFRNSIITLSSVAVTIVTIILFFLQTGKAVDESRKYLYMIKESGEIVPLEWINRRDNVIIEIKHHLQMAVDNFYDLNQFNWEEKTVNRAFWLGDFEKLHAFREANHGYDRFIQYNVTQKAILNPKDIEISPIDTENYSFKIIINIETTNTTKETERYQLFSRGKIQLTDRNFPYNPHGLWIYDYVEEQLIKIEDK